MGDRRASMSERAPAGSRTAVLAFSAAHAIEGLVARVFPSPPAGGRFRPLTTSAARVVP